VVRGGCTREDTRARIPILNNADGASRGNPMNEIIPVGVKADSLGVFSWAHV
jgi:hypothetical protein